MLEKRERKMKLRGTGKRTGAVEVLGKRISTATPIQHEMWLISLETLLMLYGEEGRGCVMEVHQELKRLDFLTPWRDAPADAEIIFVRTHFLVTHLLHSLNLLCAHRLRMSGFLGLIQIRMEIS